MKEIQRRAEYVCQALYFFGKDFCCLWTYAVYKVTVIFRNLIIFCVWFRNKGYLPRNYIISQTWRGLQLHIAAQALFGVADMYYVWCIGLLQDTIFSINGTGRYRLKTRRAVSGSTWNSSGTVLCHWLPSPLGPRIPDWHWTECLPDVSGRMCWSKRYCSVSCSDKAAEQHVPP